MRGTTANSTFAKRYMQLKNNMGYCLSYYIADEELNEKLNLQDFDVDKYITENITFEHEFLDKWFRRNEYSGDSKIWDVLLKLLAILDSSEKSILNQILKEVNYLPETVNRSRLYYNSSENCKLIFEELKKISISNIEKALDNKEIEKKLRDSDCYNCSTTYRKEQFIREFIAIQNAYYEASFLNKTVLICIG
ncbi:hypothetical protein [Flavobacterium sp. GCM10027622]|uniref:hypothetical protein n=1 Tax=unclassified Flavobacterium TaxID=196869 RepID=UPI00361A4B97